MKVIQIIKNAMIICIAYCIKAIISRTWMVGLFDLMPADQTITRLITFIKNIIAGIIKAVTRLTKR